MSSSSAEITNERKIELQSSESDIITINQSAASLSKMLENIIQDVSSASLVPIPDVTTEILNKVVEYCKAYSDSSKTEEELKAFDAEYVKVDQDTLFDILLASNTMEIKGMLDLTCQTIADMMRGKKLEEIREIFHIVNDYTPEEEEDVRKENAWVFE